MIWATLWLLLPMVLCLEISELRVPDLVDVLDNASMSCKFDLNGDSLFSVKWYKDDAEFFRYMPGGQPPVQIFPVEGVHLVEEKCNLTSVVLERLEYNTSGTYKCEVSTEGPHFRSSFGQSYMKVLGLPKEDPWIDGVLTSYAVGDFVEANCTSSPSHPTASLQWHINDEQAEDWWLVPHRTPKTRHYLSLESRSLGLNFQLDNSHFIGKDLVLKLSCSATVAGLTRRRVTVSSLAKLTNEKYAQEQHLKNGASQKGLWCYAILICVILKKWTLC